MSTGREANVSSRATLVLRGVVATLALSPGLSISTAVVPGLRSVIRF